MNTSGKPFAILSSVVLGIFGFFGSPNSYGADNDWQMPPEVHLKARFLAFSNEVSDTVPELLQFERSKKTYQVLTETNFQTLLHTIESRGNCEILDEPSAVTVSSWQTQMRATEIIPIGGRTIRLKALKFPGVETTNEIFNYSDSIEVGPILDAISQVMTNGFIIKLNLSVSVVEMPALGNNLIGHLPLPDSWTTNSAEVYVRGEKQKISFPVPEYHFQTNQITISGINLYDNQTVVLNGLDYEKRDSHNEKVAKEHLLIFVTATIVDPAGNRIRSDDEISFARDSVPPQP
jgi:hypothetical protein